MACVRSPVLRGTSGGGVPRCSAPQRLVLDAGSAAPHRRGRGRARVSARGRVLAVVAAAALLAGIGVAAVAVAQGEDVGGAEALQPLPEPRPDAPPISIDLGVRTNPEAVDLRRALALYGRKDVDGARALSSSGTSRSRPASATW